ncbi:MAG: spheroidene monooxygenase [Pseudomonadota bacterium]
MSRVSKITTVSISFFRFAPGWARVWAFAMMGLARPAMARVDGIGFWKLCGSGTGEGFTPVPNTGVYAVLATWPDLTTAKRQTKEAGIFRRYRQRAQEDWTVYLSPTSVRGQWSGTTPFEVTQEAEHGPVAALTRATVKPRAALKFWKRVPDISSVIGFDDNVVFKIGIGEVPLMQQITFSIWPDTATMANFARKDGPHARAIKAVRMGDWFREELYARFHVAASDGTWDGKHPLESIGISK